jgi:AMMECR1 domain-containing protein
MSPELLDKLFWLSRESLEYFFDKKSYLPYEKIIERYSHELQSQLSEKRSMFVVIREAKEVRGVSGMFESVEEIGKLTTQLAVNAAFFDARAPRLRPYELNEITLELHFPSAFGALSSVTYESAPTYFTDKEKGIYLATRGRIAYALPYMHEQFRDSEILLRYLYLQLGLTKKQAQRQIDFSEFTCDVFKENAQ